MKTTKEDRDKLRFYAVSDWHRDQMFSSKVIEAVLDDLDTLEARVSELEQLLGEAKPYVANGHGCGMCSLCDNFIALLTRIEVVLGENKA